jgi:uncharacterized protein (TIGR00369 family)
MRINESFARQGLMHLLGAKLQSVDRGLCNIELPYSEKITQQQHNFHGGAIGAIADNAAGYAALSVAPENMEVVTVEYKINFLASLSGGKLIAKGKVLKSGKRLIVTSCDVVHVGENDKQTLCAVLQQTLVPVEKKY